MLVLVSGECVCLFYSRLVCAFFAVGVSVCACFALG